MRLRPALRANTWPGLRTRVLVLLANHLRIAANSWSRVSSAKLAAPKVPTSGRISIGEKQAAGSELTRTDDINLNQ